MAKGIHNFTVVEAQNHQLGQNGAVIIDGTDAITGPFIAITALEDSVVDTSECDVTWLSGTVPATFKIPASGTIYAKEFKSSDVIPRSFNHSSNFVCSF